MLRSLLRTGLLTIAIALGSQSIARAAEDTKVGAVASFSILADMVHQVGGERVTVTTLVGPNSDAHVYRPTPADAKAVAEADLVIINGLGFEGWLPRLVEASATVAPVIAVSRGASLIGAAGSGADVDPHAWNDVGNALIYVANIADGLCRIDSEGCDLYRRNAAAYTADLELLDEEVRAEIERLPAAQRTLIMPHTALGYFARRYGLTILAPEGLSTEGEASARDVAVLIRQVREAKASALFPENIKDRRLIEQIARESGIPVGGALYTDALSGPDGPAPTYLDMIRHNARTIVAGASDG